VQVREWGCERLRIERRPNRSGDATAQVEELDGEPAITSTAASAPKPVDVAAHGSQKLFGAFGGGGPVGTTKFFRSLGFRAPLLMALAAGLGELVGGLLFAVGLLTPLAALILTVVMLNAIGTVHWKKGFFNSAGRYEFNLVILATVVAITAIGPGRYSLDGALGWAEAISGPWWLSE
jgi:putative oxidoreductase